MFKSTNQTLMAYFLSALMFISSVGPAISGGTRMKNTALMGRRAQSFNSFDSGYNNNSLNSMDIAMMPGGPDQPESSSFTPIGVSDMVDPFSGSFTYNIPLMDVDGYPLNLAYTGNSGMNAEASWVGLGWSLNPGAVNRNMRGLPDDFKGDVMEKESNKKTDFTLGVTGSISTELFGLDKIPGAEVSLSAQAALEYNNYTGFGANWTVSPSISLFSKDKGKSNSGKLNLSLGLSGSSTSGPSISPGISYSTQDKLKTLSIGMPYSSRQGIQELSYALDIRASKVKTQDDVTTEDIDESRVRTNKYSNGSSFNFMQATYTPNLPNNRLSAGFTFKAKFSPDLVGADLPAGTLGGYIRFSKDLEKNLSSPAYGYIYMGEGDSRDDATLDFNRENDGPYTKGTPTIGLPVTTADIFTVSAQGIGGSYMPFTTEIPYTYDKASKSNSVNGSGGVEFGAGGLLKAGIDITGSYSNVKTGAWREGNNALNSLGFSGPVLQFREANEASVLNSLSNYNAFGGEQPIYYSVTAANPFLFGSLRTQSGKYLGSMPKKEANFNKANQLFRAYTIEEVKSGVIKGNYSSYASRTGRKDHHIGAIAVTSTEGKRFIYGIAAYNGEQENYAFAVGAGPAFSGNTPELPDNLVSYDSQDMSKSNRRGIDNFYEMETTPAHAHSYLITEILSPDYIDNDGTPGASEGDFGMYHKFDYSVFSNFKWRTPIEQGKAVYSAGLYSDRSDDKASVTYGTKELWYVKTIESKNQIAVFHTSNRDDGYGVIDKNGGLNTNGTCQKKLDSIQLFNADDYNNGVQIPIKTVHFRYSYELCKNYHQNPNAGGGKLTLEEVFFTYENSNMGRYNKYVFSYGFNPNFNRSAVDRWGDYKPVNPASGEFDNLRTDPLNPFDEPYTIQDETQHNMNVSAWQLNKIDLPSGGRIEVEYEANRYRFVQNKAAMTMFKVVGITTDNTVSTTSSFDLLDLNNGGDPQKLVVEVGNTSSGYSTNINDYLGGISKLYFRAFMRLSPTATTTHRYDYVPGYADINRAASSIVVENAYSAQSDHPIPF